jgi:hypothetical protein
MARHKSDKQTTQLLAEMGETRKDLNEVIGGLLAEGTTKAEIARAASWNAGYLSEFLESPEKRPTTRKIEALIAALSPFVKASSNAEFAVALGRLSSRYGIKTASVTDPTAGLIPASAPNWVRRRDVDRVLELSCETSGDYAIDGQPMVGISSALLYVEGMLRDKGYAVRRLSAGERLVASTYGRESRTGMLGLIAAALTESQDSLDLDFFGVQDGIRDYLLDLGQPFALLIDDVNQLEQTEVESLKRLLRDWSTRRAAGEPPFTDVTTWLAVTSGVRNARLYSNFLATYTVLRWFWKEEVRELGQALAPYSVASGVVESMRWPAQAAEEAWSLFAGQPHLTHLFLWDRHMDGETDDDEILEKAPAGAYKRHVDTLARSLVNLLGHSEALSLVQYLGGAAGDPTPANLAAADSLGIVNPEQLGIVDPEHRWSCPYYRAHLPRAVEVMAGDAARARVE